VAVNSSIYTYKREVRLPLLLPGKIFEEICQTGSRTSMDSWTLIAIIVSFLSQNAIVAASIGTISGIVVGFASQNLIGNMIAGIYLALTRPFKIGDMITVFGKSGKVYDIGLLNCDLLMKNGDIVRAPSSSLLTTPVVILLHMKNSQESIRLPAELPAGVS
jgi:small-conductance mechanosensitive channel